MKADMPDKTYSESQGVEPFDWWKALDNPEAHANDEISLAERSGSWATCACGNQCALIPRSDGMYTGAPNDHDLFYLGIDFSDDVCNEDWESAKATLSAIEARSAVLIAEIRAAQANDGRTA